MVKISLPQKENGNSYINDSLIRAQANLDGTQVKFLTRVQRTYALGVSLLMGLGALCFRRNYIVAAKEAWQQFLEGNRFERNQRAHIDQANLEAMVTTLRSSEPVLSIALCLEDESARMALADCLPTDPFGNTGLTNLMQLLAFEKSDTPDLQPLNQLLVLLRNEALAGKQWALNALKRSNNDNKSIRIAPGFPQNTPLLLLVKMDNLEGIKAILPALNKEDLLAVTSTGNTALHIAVLTARFDMASAILKRAGELDIFDELLAKKNRVGHTPDAMRLAVSNFRPWMGSFFEDYFGGEEIQKANLGKNSVLQSLQKARAWLSLYFEERIADITLAQIANVPDEE
jgi:hypothetical protein